MGGEEPPLSGAALKAAAPRCIVARWFVSVHVVAVWRRPAVVAVKQDLRSIR